MAKYVGCEVATDRGLANIAYQQRALSLLYRDPRFVWLGMDEAAVMAGKMKMRRTILQQLGRIGDEDELRFVAGELCRLKPTTSKAIAMIREYRGVQHNGKALDLANILVGTVNRYLDSHRGMAWDEVRDALRTAAGQIDQAEAKETEVHR
jgi:hypothetical protein